MLKKKPGLKGCAKQNILSVATPDEGLLGIVVEQIFGHAEASVFVDSFVESQDVGEIREMSLLVDELLNLGVDLRDLTSLNFHPLVALALQTGVLLFQLGYLSVQSHIPFLVSCEKYFH